MSDSSKSQPASDTRRAIQVAVERELGLAGEDTDAPADIPDHELLRRIGSGAYGDVWLARNTLGTLRAVKIVYRARFEENRPYEREFHGILKYEPISRTHEGLVQVLHVGRNDDTECFYYVMELADAENVEGRISNVELPVQERAENPDSSFIIRYSGAYSPRTLHSELRKQPRLPPTEAAQFTLFLASALIHLHGHGLVHRDIKPSNVIFVNGRPKLADIGLVTGAGASRSFVGTEGFVPPEGPGQAQGDIYALGKLLYELATGRDRMDFPQLPADSMESPDREALLELNEVMTRACAPETPHRYASAREFQAELNLFLAGRSLRHTRNMERNMARLKKIAVTACIFLALAAVALRISKREERHARERANVETALRLRAVAAEHESRQQLYTALLEQSRAAVRSGAIGHRVRVLDALRRAAAISNTVELRTEATAALALPDVRFEREWFGGSDVTAVDFDSDFKRMAVSRGTGAVEIRAVSDFKLLVMLPPIRDGASFRTAWSAGDRYLAVRRDQDIAGERADLEVWDVAVTNRVLLLRDVPRGALGFHPTLPRLVTATSGGPVTVWNIESGKELKSFIINGVPDALEFSPDGKRIAASYPSSGSWMITVHDAERGDVLASGRFRNRIPNVAWHPQGQWIAAPDYSGSVYLMNSHTGAASAIGRHKTTAYNVVFSPDGRYLVSGGWDRELICWDVAGRQRVFTLPLDSLNLHFRADGKQCAVVGNGRVQFHAFESPTAHREFGALLGANVNYAAFSPDGQWLAASGDKRLGVWHMTNQTLESLANEAGDARPFFRSDSTELFGSSREDACFRWRIVTSDNVAARLERVPLSKPAGFTALCLSSNRIVWTSRLGSRSIALDESSETDEWMPTLPGVSQVSPDGQWLGIFRPFTPLLHVYRLPGLESVVKLTAQANISAMSFSRPGGEITAVSRNTLEFWDINTGQRTRVLSNCSHIVFAPDGLHAWMRLDRVAGLYHLGTLKPLILLPGDTTPLALSPDGRHLAMSVDARRLQVWDLVEIGGQLQALGLSWDTAHRQISVSR
jgi:serine/threonine protein kinase/WD40 repeat protein